MGRDTRRVGAAAQLLVQLHAVAEAGLARRRVPHTARALVRHLPLAIGLEAAVGAALAQVEIQAAHTAALSQGQAHFSLAIGGQQTHVIIQVDFLRPGRRTGHQA
ncbi:hypothetical protein D3C80_1518090 [compost metagenome]